MTEVCFLAALEAAGLGTGCEHRDVLGGCSCLLAGGCLRPARTRGLSSVGAYRQRERACVCVSERGHQDPTLMTSCDLNCLPEAPSPSTIGRSAFKGDTKIHS